MSTTEQQNAISLAVLETEMHHVKAGVADVKFQNARQNEKMEEILKGMNAINQQIAGARGGFKALMLMGTLTGSVGGFIGWLIANWKG